MVSINQVFSLIIWGDLSTEWHFRSCLCIPLAHAINRLNQLKPSSLAHTLQKIIVWDLLDQDLSDKDWATKLFSYNWRRLWGELKCWQVQWLDMVELGPPQENPHQADPQLTELVGSQQQNNPLNPRTNLGNRRNHEGSVHTAQTSQSYTQIGSHVSQRRNNHQAMQREIDDLKRKLRRAQRK